MPPEPERRSSFQEAGRIKGERLELIHAVLQAQRNYYDLWGAWPSATQIAAQIGLTRGETP